MPAYRTTSSAKDTSQGKKNRRRGKDSSTKSRNRNETRRGARSPEPSFLTSGAVLQLQRTVGNRATRRLFRQATTIQRQEIPLGSDTSSNGAVSDQSSSESTSNHEETDSEASQRTIPQDITVMMQPLDIGFFRFMDTSIISTIRGADFSASSLEVLVFLAKRELESEQHYIRKLTLIGHGYTGHMEGNITEAGIAETEAKELGIHKLSSLRGYFGPDSLVRLDSCEVGQGAQGEMLLQSMANTLGVPVSGQTGHTNVYGLYALGEEVITQPGEESPPYSRIIADQVYEAVQSGGIKKDRYATIPLQEARHHRILSHVIYLLWKDNHWQEVRAYYKKLHGWALREDKHKIMEPNIEQLMGVESPDLKALEDLGIHTYPEDLTVEYLRMRHQQELDAGKEKPGLAPQLQQPLGPDGGPDTDSESNANTAGYEVTVEPE